jgi:hypothetical protein
VKRFRVFVRRYFRYTTLLAYIFVF